MLPRTVQDGNFRANLTTAEERKGKDIAEASGGEHEQQREKGDKREGPRRNVRFGNEVTTDTDGEVAATGSQSDEFKAMKGENAKLMRRVLDLVKSMEAKQNIVTRGAAIQVRGRNYRGTGHSRNEMGHIEIGQVDHDESQRRDDVMNAKQVVEKESLREKNEKLRDLLKFAKEVRERNSRDVDLPRGRAKTVRFIRCLRDGCIDMNGSVSHYLFVEAVILFAFFASHTVHAISERE